MLPTTHIDWKNIVYSETCHFACFLSCRTTACLNKQVCPRVWDYCPTLSQSLLCSPEAAAAGTAEQWCSHCTKSTLAQNIKLHSYNTGRNRVLWKWSLELIRYIY